MKKVHVTNREEQIIDLIAREYTSKEIAQRLFICKSTVDTHRKRLMCKLNVKNTAGLIRVGFVSGILQGSNMSLQS